MSFATGQPWDANTPFAQMISEVRQQMTNFENRLQQLSLSPNDILGSTIDVTHVGLDQEVMIDGLRYRVSVHDVTALVVPPEEDFRVNRITLTDFAGTERSFLCDVILDNRVSVLVSNEDQARFTCGTHGDNGPQAWGRRFLGPLFTYIIEVIGIETADRLAQRFQPPVRNGRHDYDQLVDELYAMQDSLYTIHRRAIRVNHQDYRQQLQQMVGGMRGRLAALEIASTDLLDIAVLAHDVFERAMVVQEVLPRVPSPPGLPPIVPPLVPNLAIDEAQAFQMPAAADLLNFEFLSVGILVRLDHIEAQIQVLNELFMGLPLDDMFIDLNGPNGDFLVNLNHVNEFQVNIRVEGNQWRRDIIDIDTNQRRYTAVYQPDIQRWLVFAEVGGELEYALSAGPFSNRCGGQAMSVRVGDQHRLYFIGDENAQFMRIVFTEDQFMQRVRRRRRQLIDLGHDFYLAVEAMDRELRAAPEAHWLAPQAFPELLEAMDPRIEEFPALLDECRGRYREVLNAIQQLYESVKMTKEYFDCAVYLPHNHF